MKNRSLSWTLALILTAAACGDGTKEESPGEVLARDSSLASDLKQADTSAFAEAADVAMAFDPDSALPPAVVKPSAPAAAVPSTTTPATAAPTTTVPMRVDRSTPVSSTPPSPAARAPMRPAPATIHPDPVPTTRMPAAPASRSTTTSGAAPAARATSILEKVPGATLPPAGSDEPCASPASADQRRCLMLHLARTDVALDRTYQALIADLKREAGTPARGREPETVTQLRVAQRAWLVYRDTECRRRNRGKEGPLWAPVRAECLGEFSGQRTEELARALRERQGR
ncbi:MAG TPA: lysozyme inhibitor LprI family protein [Gemmatimonadaceae bacterium]|nr:lysozyme inhibitor LprI family protein [Gemmatimonadaceae bacterium]